MSIEHFTAAFNCKLFKNGARLLLLALANRASDGEPRKDGRDIKYGWSYAGVGRLMADINASSRDTVIDNMKVLVGAGVVKRERRLSHSSLSFVDIDVLRSLAYTEEDVAEFKRKADTKVGKSTTTGHDAREKALPLKSGESATTDVGEIPLSDVGEFPPSDVWETPAAVVGKSPTHNQKVNPQYEPQGSYPEVLEPSESESKMADADSDGSGKSNASRSPSCPGGLGEQEDQGKSPDPDDKDLQSGDESTGSRKTKDSPGSLPKESDPDPKEYEEIVHLCSLWRATHSNPMDEIETTPVPKPHPWGHPRTWTPAQRREAFLSGEWQDDDPNSMEEPSPDPEPEPEEDGSGKVEEALLRDEGQMLELLQKHGRDVVEELLIWLPKSDFWHSKIKSLAKLRTDFDRVYGSYQKYLQKAEDSGTDVECADFVFGVFLEFGGGAADSICYERLHPINPADAAEEQAMDAFDDEFGVVLFNPWAEEDYAAAMAAQKAEESGDESYDASGDEDSAASQEQQEEPENELDACVNTITLPHLVHNLGPAAGETSAKKVLEESTVPDQSKDLAKSAVTKSSVKSVAPTATAISESVLTAKTTAPPVPAMPELLYCDKCHKLVEPPHNFCPAVLKAQLEAKADKQAEAERLRERDRITNKPYLEATESFASYYFGNEEVDEDERMELERIWQDQAFKPCFAGNEAKTISEFKTALERARGDSDFTNLICNQRAPEAAAFFLRYIDTLLMADPTDELGRDDSEEGGFDWVEV